MKFTTRFLMSLLCTISLGTQAQAAKPSIALEQYYAATCEDYTGSWQGFMTDPTDLFSTGGPWPVTVTLLNKGQSLIGKTSTVNYAKDDGEFKAKPIWAQCKQGVLSNIFWGNKHTCGSYSQSGMLVSKNVLVLTLNYESAMNGTSLLLFLTRKNNTYTGAMPKHSSEFELGEITSCH